MSERRSRNCPQHEAGSAQDYDSWSVAKLQAKCKELGIVATGRKAWELCIVGSCTWSFRKPLKGE
eukprot:1427388-Amphidinium_carterae.1